MTSHLRALILSFACLCSTFASVEPPAIADLFALPDMRALELSPDGKTLALLTRNQVEDVLMTMDLTTMKSSVAAHFGGGAYGRKIWWKSNDLLLVDVALVTGNELRLFNLRDGKMGQLRDLNRGNPTVISTLPTDPDSMLVSFARSTGSDLRRVNLRTGRMETVEKNPGAVSSWVTDRKGRAIAALGLDNNKWFMLTRAPGEDWKRTELGTRSQPDFYPLAAHDGDRLLGWDFTTDLANVVAWEPRTGAKDVVLRSDDVEPRFLNRNGNDTIPDAALIDTDRRHVRYLNEPERQLLRKIDEALPGTTNLVISASADQSRLIIQSSLPGNLERYWLLDRSAGRLAPLGVSRTALAQVKLSQPAAFAFTARDGLRLHGWLYPPTSTPADRPPPAVVLIDNINGGIDLGWDPLIQLLATRGYAVLQVAHRGGPRYGTAFAEAGDRRVHDGMPDDIAEAVDHAVQQRWIDGARVAVHGANSGGVLASYVLSRHPAKFAAWLNFNTPLNRAAVPLGALIVGRPEVRTSGFLNVHDESRLKNYRDRLDASHVLEQLQIPSFHFYSNGSDTARSVVSRKLQGRPFEFLEALSWNKTSNDPAAWAQQRRQEDERVYGALIAFLDAHLKARPAPSAAAR